MGVLLALLRELMLQLMDLLSLGLLLRLTGTASAKRTSARMFAGLTNAASAHTVQVELVLVRQKFIELIISDIFTVPKQGVFGLVTVGLFQKVTIQK